MASILKPHQSAPKVVERATGMEGVAGFNLDDFAEAGVRHLKGVEKEAARILAEARASAEQIKQTAQQEGFSKGLKDAEAEAERRVQAGVQREVAAKLPMLESVVQQISDLEQQYLAEFQEALLGTVLAATERMVLARLESEPATLKRWAELAIGVAKTARKLVVAVHPETLVVHGEDLESLLSAPGLPEDVRIEPDEAVEPAGIVVRCEGGAVEMTLSKQLERLDEMLRGGEHG